jgi:hypothetical protein
MAWYRGVCLPSAFILLGGKKGSTYRRMICELKKEKSLDKRSEQHPNVWKFVELLQSEELHASIKFERINDDTLKLRGRKRVDLVRDLEITTAKNVYLQSDSIDTMDDLEHYLNTVKQLVQQF